MTVVTGVIALHVTFEQVWQPFIWLVQVWQACDCYTGLTGLHVTVVASVRGLHVIVVQVWQACDCCTGVTDLQVTVAQVWQASMWLLYKRDSPSCDCCYRYDRPSCDCCTGMTALHVTCTSVTCLHVTVVIGITGLHVTVIQVWQPFMWLVQVWQAFMWLLYWCDRSSCDLYRCDRPLCDCCTGVTGQTAVSSTITTPPLCEDKLDNCASYGQQYCGGDYLAWASDNCAGFCKLCDCKSALVDFVVCKSRFLCRPPVHSH